MPDSSFLRSALVVMGGNGLGHLALLAASPLLTRLYTPEQFGIYGAFVAVLLIVVSVAGLRFELAVPAAREESDAVRLAVLALGAVGTIALLTGVVAAALRWSPGGGGWGGSWLAPALALGVLALGAYQVASNWAVRTRQYTLLATSRLTRSLAQVVAQLGFGALGGVGWGLVAGHLTGGFSGMARLLIGPIAALRDYRPKLRELRGAASRYRAFPLYSVPSGLLNAAGNQLPLLIVINAYGLEVGGAFALAQRVLAAPITVISQAVGQVFVGQIREPLHADPGAAAALYRATVWRLAGLGFVPAALLVFLAPSLFSFAFGEQWTLAGDFAQALGPMLLAQFTVLPVSSVLNLLERTRLQLGYDVLRVMFALVPLVALALIGYGPTSAIAGYSFGMSVALVVNGVIGYLVVRHRRLDEVS